LRNVVEILYEAYLLYIINGKPLLYIPTIYILYTEYNNNNNNNNLIFLVCSFPCLYNGLYSIKNKGVVNIYINTFCIIP